MSECSKQCEEHSETSSSIDSEESGDEKCEYCDIICGSDVFNRTYEFTPEHIQTIVENLERCHDC